MSEESAALIKLMIGWLFELPNFPLNLYYSWQAKYNSKALKNIKEVQETVAKIESNYQIAADTSVISVKENLFLDKLKIVDDRALYTCCSYLKELNILLNPGNTNVSSTTFKHVTPVTCQLRSSSKKANATNTEVKYS